MRFSILDLVEIGSLAGGIAVDRDKRTHTDKDYAVQACEVLAGNCPSVTSHSGFPELCATGNSELGTRDLPSAIKS